MTQQSPPAGIRLSLGDAGSAVAEVRSRLVRIGLLEDSGGDVFDASVDEAVRRFQQERGLRVDGIVGPQTFRRLEEARWRLGDRVLAYTPGHLISGDDVWELQRRLMGLGFDTGRPDGIFGVRTDAALREFQRNVGLEPDGMCGPAAFRSFERLTRTVGGGRSEDLREYMSLTALHGSVADKVVVIDQGSGDHEATITADLATRVEGRLAALGTQVLLTHGPTAAPDEAVRAAFANDTGADVVVSLHVDHSESSRPNGLATFYFGDPVGGGHSLAGRRAAELLQEEICSRTDLLDCRSHPRTWDLLRLTRMPAVRVEVGYATHAGDAQRLGDPRFRDAVAEAISAAVVRLFAPTPSA